MRFIKIRQYVERYTLDTVIDIVDESDIAEFEKTNKHHNYIKQHIGWGEDKHSVKFYIDSRKTLEEDHAHHGDINLARNKNLDFIILNNVYYISLEYQNLHMEDIMLELNTKFGIIDPKDEN